jgi:hypothetical protein
MKRRMTLPRPFTGADASLPWSRWVVCLLAAGLLGSGCTSRTELRREQLKAYEEGRRRALEAQQQDQSPAVFFRGDVRNNRVPWHEGLTLVEALAVAHYTWNWDPHLIRVTRGGQEFPIEPRRLLRGQENPELEPGDIVDVHH